MGNKVRKIRGDANLPSILWCYSYEHATDIYGAMIYSATQESLDYLCYKTRRSINNFRVLGCHILAIKGTNLSNSVDRTETEYFLGTTDARSVIRYSHSSRQETIGYYSTAKFNKNKTLDPSGNPSPGATLTYCSHRMQLR